MRLIDSTALFLLVTASACGTETGNGATTIKLGLTVGQTEVDPTALVGADAQGTAFKITSARAYLRHIELQRPGGKTECGDLKPSNKEFVKCDGGKIRVNGPFQVDLVSKEAMPSLAGLEIPAETYNRVDIRLEEAKPSDGVVPANDPLSGLTLIASGTFAYPAGSSTPFDFALKFNEDARFDSVEGITVEENAVQDMLLFLDVASWFSTLPITQCITDGDLVIQGGRLTIEDKGSGGCSAIEGALKETIKTSGRLSKKKI